MPESYPPSYGGWNEDSTTPARPREKRERPQRRDNSTLFHAIENLRNELQSMREDIRHDHDEFRESIEKKVNRLETRAAVADERSLSDRDRVSRRDQFVYWVIGTIVAVLAIVIPILFSR